MTVGIRQFGQGLRHALDFISLKIPDMVHDSALSDPLLKLRHRNFQITHVASAILACIVLIVYFNIHDVRKLPSYLFYFCFSSPLIIVLYLWRTGRIDIAQFLSSLNLSALAGIAACYTGGINSPLVLWMLIVPLEAALSRRRLMTYMAVFVSGLTLALLYYLTVSGKLPEPLAPNISMELFTFLSTLAAVAYAGGIAVTVQRMNRMSSRALRVSDENYRFLADNATDLITRHGVDGSVRFASQACHRIIGIEPEALERDGFLEWVHEEDRAAFLHAISTSARNKLTMSEEIRVCKAAAPCGEGPGCEYIWIEMRCRPVSDVRKDYIKQSAVSEVLAVSRDISLRKAQEFELERAKEHAESASRAKSLFVASISHELRTPLNAIVGFSDIIASELSKADVDEKLIEYIGIIEEGGHHLKKIVNDILDMSKIEAGKFEISPEACDLNELIKLSCGTVKSLAQQREISIDHGACEGGLEIVCDLHAVTQIMFNLLSNAVKFSHEGGIVKVTTEMCGENVLIKVIDQGVGIAAEDIAKLGKPFVQVDNAYSRKAEGTGLGLSVVNGLIALHNGRMSIDSEIAAGTVISVALPIDGPEGAAMRRGTDGIDDEAGRETALAS